MNLFETICGAQVDDLQSNEVLLETTRRSQEVRTRQSLLSMVLVSIVGAGYMWALWDHTDHVVLTLWVVVIVALTVQRSVISKRIRMNLEDANAQTLVQNEMDLVITGITLPLVVGAGYWLFCSPDDNITTLAVTLICCLYAVGSTVNTVAQRRMQGLMVSLNLGQGVLFFLFSGVTEYYALALQVSALLLLLLGFAIRMDDMFVDIVKSQLEIRERNKQLLQNRIDLEVALEDSVDASKAKSQFLAAASHDLSQPLHAMSLFIGNLKQTVGASEKQQDLIRKIETTSEILKQQFDGLLDMTRYDAGGVTVQKQMFDLNALCRIIVQNEGPVAQQRGVALTISGDAEVLEVNSDPVLLGRLVGNLVSNAIKFTSEGSVELQLEQSGENAILTVTDTGCGISDSDKERIFEDFVQIDNAARNREKGAGLGLSIVRRIAKLLDVNVAVESTPSVGSKFILSIPQDDSVIASIHNERSASAAEYLEPQGDEIHHPLHLDLEGLNILVVDDDIHIREAISAFVSSRNGNALLASSIIEARELSDNNEVDFAIVDDMLGSDTTGLELASSLANEIALNRIIVVTGNILPQRMEILRSSGFGIYSKPLSATQLDEILSERLNYRVNKDRVFGNSA